MMKFFRKYTKHMLAVFMTLLLVVWLGGPALQSQFDPGTGSRVWARAFGQELVERDKTRFDNETRLLDRLGYYWWSSLRFASTAAGSEPLDPVDWFLLREEARNMGVVIPETKIDEVMNGIPKATYDAIRGGRSRSVSVEAIRQTVANYLRVNRAAALATDAVRISEPQLRQMARKSLERVRVRFITFPASNFFDGTEEIPEDEVLAHFEKYKDTPVGSSAGEGYGYQIPTRLTVQFIQAEADKVAAEIKPPVMITEQEAREYYDSHKAFYVKRQERKPPPPSTQPASARPAPATTKPTGAPQADAPAAKPATPTTRPTAVKGAIVYAQDAPGAPTASKPVAVQAATRPRPTTPAAVPAPVPPKPPEVQYRPFEEVRAEIEEKLRHEHAGEKAAEVMTRIRDELVRGWYGAERDSEGYAIAPPAAADPDHYNAVLKKVQKRWKLAKTFTVGMTEPFDATVSKAARVPQLGRSRPVDPGVSVGGFSNLVVKVKGVAKYPDRDDSSADTTLYLGEHQTCPIVLKDDTTGNVFLFRVVKIEPAHAPASVKEVRLKILADLRKLHGYRRAEETARRVERIARAKGIQAAYASLDEEGRKRMRLNSPPAFARITRTERPPSRFSRGGTIEQPSSVRGIYGSNDSRERFINACFELGEATTTQPTDHKVRLMGRQDAQQWVLIEWIETLPMRRDAYRKERDKLMTLARQQQRTEVQTGWFDRENLRKRTGYHEEKPPEAEDKEPGATADATG